MKEAKCKEILEELWVKTARTFIFHQTDDRTGSHSYIEGGSASILYRLVPRMNICAIKVMAVLI